MKLLWITTWQPISLIIRIYPRICGLSKFYSFSVSLSLSLSLSVAHLHIIIRLINFLIFSNLIERKLLKDFIHCSNKNFVSIFIQKLLFV